MKGYEDDKKVAVEALEKIDPWKPLGTDLFNAIARIIVTVPVETVAIRRNLETGKVEVLLTQRSQEEAYPGQWHSPGSFLRVGEEIEDVFRRLEEKEFGVKILRFDFIGYHSEPFLPSNTRDRGQAVQLIFLCEIENGGNGDWFPVDGLPELIVENHRHVLIPMAVKAYQRQTLLNLKCPFGCDFNLTDLYKEDFEKGDELLEDFISLHLKRHFPEREG